MMSYFSAVLSNLGGCEGEDISDEHISTCCPYVHPSAADSSQCARLLEHMVKLGIAARWKEKKDSQPATVKSP